jgi:hypothetical protein
VGTGIRLRRLWHLKLGVIASLIAAAAAALWLTPRSLEMASASTHVVVDTPTSALVDLRQDTYSLDALRNRAVLLGNVIAGSRVRQNIASRLDLPVEQLRVQAPLTREQAAPPVDSENARHTSDILKSTHEYRLNVQANLTVPMLDIYAQSPTAESATILVNSAVQELRRYLADLAAAEKTPPKDQIRLIQLGRGRGVVINEGINWQVSLLVFLLAFGVCAATVIFIDRVRSGWRTAALSEGGQPA